MLLDLLPLFDAEDDGDGGFAWRRKREEEALLAALLLALLEGDELV